MERAVQKAHRENPRQRGIRLIRVGLLCIGGLAVLIVVYRLLAAQFARAPDAETAVAELIAPHIEWFGPKLFVAILLIAGLVLLRDVLGAFWVALFGEDPPKK